MKPLVPTWLSSGKPISALGAEEIEIRGGKIPGFLLVEVSPILGWLGFMFVGQS